jgi:hypothetical protein
MWLLFKIVDLIERRSRKWEMPPSYEYFFRIINGLVGLIVLELLVTRYFGITHF